MCDLISYILLQSMVESSSGNVSVNGKHLGALLQLMPKERVEFVIHFWSKQETYFSCKNYKFISFIDSILTQNKNTCSFSGFDGGINGSDFVCFIIGTFDFDGLTNSWSIQDYNLLHFIWITPSKFSGIHCEIMWLDWN